MLGIRRILTGNGLGAAHTLLCIQVAEALQAVGVIVPAGEALAWQLLSAADAEEAVAVPGLVLVGHPTCCDGLEAAQTQQEKEQAQTWDTQDAIPGFPLYVFSCPASNTKIQSDPTFLQAQHWYANCFSKQGTQK